MAYLRLRIQGTAARGDGRSQLDRIVLSRRGDGAGGGASPVLLLPPPRRAQVSRGMGGGQLRQPCSRARHRRRASPRAALGRQEAVACARHAIGTIARWRDGAAGNRKFFDRAEPGVIMVAGRLSHSAIRAPRRHAADAALDAARIVSGIPAGAACEFTTRSLPPCGGGLGSGVAARSVLVATPLSHTPPPVTGGATPAGAHTSRTLPAP